MSEKTMWKAWLDRVEPVTVIRETAAFVTIRTRSGNEYRAKKDTVHMPIFPTWSEARDHLVEMHRREMQGAEARMNSAREKKRAAERLTKPEGA